MKAVVYNGPRDVAVVEVSDAKIERPTDALVRITTTNIRGSDLHTYEGRTDMEPGQVLGHENLGQVVDIGDAVDRVKVGDWVCLPFNIACGFCRNCERGLTGFCLTVNPGSAGAAYGFAGMGRFRGGQAEFLRVPYADFNCLRLPRDAEQKQADYVMLADIFPTGYHATELACVQAGDSVVVFGAGPVGLMAAYSAPLKSARKVMLVDRRTDRLRLGEKIGVIPIDDSKGSPTTASCATSSPKARLSPPSWCPTKCPSRKRRKPTAISMPVTRAGPRWSSSPESRPLVGGAVVIDGWQECCPSVSSSALGDAARRSVCDRRGYAENGEAHQGSGVCDRRRSRSAL